GGLGAGQAGRPHRRVAGRTRPGQGHGGYPGERGDPASTHGRQHRPGACGRPRRGRPADRARAPGFARGQRQAGTVTEAWTDDGHPRCTWARFERDSPANRLYRDYHDFEWGVPLRGPDAMFERMCLEAFQSGLAWITVLRKREHFRRAFDGFRVERVAAFGETDVARLLGDSGIVRNRAKIEAAIANARVAAGLDTPLDELIWTFAPPPRPRPRHPAEIPATSAESVALAKELK